MALNSKVERKTDIQCLKTGELDVESGESKKNSWSAAISATSNQNGDQTGCEDRIMPEQEASERRRSGHTDTRSSNNSPLPGQRPAEQLPRRNFQIPRKIKERKGLYQFLPPDSREFEGLVKILSSSYLDASSRGTFSYSKARLIHNELLEKEFIEKRRELKQEGRTDPELVESYCFMFPDKSKLPLICEKGLSVGHSRITALGNPAMGVYLSKFSDLLQMNPFEAGTCGDIVVFKVMRGRLKSIFENMPKSVLDPTPKFDCHVSKNATRVTSLLSYRAFELTQQYFYEFAFDEIKSRPRHVCPYAVVSFQYKGKESAAAPMAAHRFNSTVCEGGSRKRSSYTVWSGPLVNKGQELCQVCLCSTRHFLPFKLAEKLEMSIGMQLDQVKRKIPSVLFSWDTYSGTREVLKCGMYCSLFEVVDGKGKASTSTLSGLIHKLERERMVLLKPLFDKGFLFLLSSTQMVNPKERQGRFEKSLQALFIFQESRGVIKYKQEPLTSEPQPPLLVSMEPFIPALHYALLKMRSTPDIKHLSTGVERQALDYLTRRDSVRAFLVPEYQQNLDERGSMHPAPRPKSNMEGLLRSYLHGPSSAYVLPIIKARDMMDRINQPPSAPAPTTTDYSPVSDWGGSGGSDRPERQPPESSSSRRRGGPSQTQAHSNGAAAGTGAPPQRSRLAQSDYDKEKMKQLLKLIQLHKKALVKEPGEKERDEGGDDGSWEGPHGLKRKLEEDESRAMYKYLRGAHFRNGEPSRVAQGEEEDEGGNYNLEAVMESMGIYNTDLRDRGNSSQASSANETQRLLKILLSTLNKAMAQGAAATDLPDHGEPTTGTASMEKPLAGAPYAGRVEQARQDCLEEQTECSLASLFSPGSPGEQHHTSENPPLTLDLASHTDKPFPFLDVLTDGHLEQRRGLEGGDRGQSGDSLERETVTRQASIERVASGASLERALRGASLESERVARGTSVERDSRVERPARPSSTLDTIISQGLHCLSNSIQGLMETQRIYYNSQLSPRLPQRLAWQPNSSFSYFVAPYVVSVPVQGHVNTLCERMGRLVPQPRHTDSAKAHGARSTLCAPPTTVPPPPHALTPAPPKPSLPPPPHHIHLTPNTPILTLPSPPHSLTSIPPLPPTPHLPPPTALVHLPDPVPITSPTPKHVPKTKAQPPQDKSASSSQSRHKLGTVKQPHKNPSAAQKPSTKRKFEPSSSECEIYSPSQATMGSPECTPTRPKQAPLTAPSPLTPASAAGLLIGQLKPEVFSSLVEIFKDVQKNTVKFYIHSGDEESDICVEIKEYLMSLGNTECNPQTFLEKNRNLDKLLIIIQNEDISSHVNKIPALVSLKKLSMVSFAGVDSLDDVKNHTYNELFVSGGFIVSDEFVLNPDFITHDRLQAFLGFLEEQSSPENPWQWKIHCKSQKKLKELGRLNSDVMALLNLLTAYQKKHLVEFLPYHECDAQSRQAPDLDCLVKLQANHTQHRHIIFLTERRFEMFLQYSRNGIVIANIDDIMTSFHSLIGCSDLNELPTPPSTVVHDECVEEEDMSLDSDDDTQNQLIAKPPAQSQEGGTGGGMGDATQQPPLPESDDFRPPLPDQLNTPGRHTPSSLSYSSGTTNLADFAALKSAISQFKASNQVGRAGLADVGSTSPGAFAVNPHQSFLCPSTQWASYSGSSGYTASPAYPASPCSSNQEQDYRHPATAPTTAPGSTLTTGPLTSQAPLTLSDIPQPPLPPHLTLGGALSQSFRMPGSDTGAAGVGVGASFSIASSTSILSSTAIKVSSFSPSTALTYSDSAVASLGLGYSQSEMAQHGYLEGVSSSTNGTPTQQGDRTLSGPGESPWGLGGGTPNSQGGATPGSVSHSRLTQSGERERTGTPGGSTPGSQGGRTPVNSIESLGAGMAIASVATRGGSIARPMLPILGGTGGSRGGLASVHPLSDGRFSCIGAMPGQMDGGMERGSMVSRGMGPGSLGECRGRGAPPEGPWPRPGEQDYYSDYTYSHNYSP